MPASAVRQLVQLKGIATTSASVLLDEGLVWRAAGTHPMSAKAPGFGTWAQPPSLEPEERP